MTAKELATRLDGRQNYKELTYDEERIAKKNDLVVIFGYSDDNIEFRGAINDEWGAWEGGTYYISEYCNVFGEPSLLEKCKKIEALWCDGDGPAWTYKTNIPHETFNIYEEDELFCIGIVFSMKEAFGA